MSQFHSSTATAKIRFAFDKDANEAIANHVQSPFSTLKESIDKLIEVNGNRKTPQIQAPQMQLATMQRQFESQFAQISIGLSLEKQDYLWELMSLPF